MSNKAHWHNLYFHYSLANWIKPRVQRGTIGQFQKILGSFFEILATLKVWNGPFKIKVYSTKQEPKGTFLCVETDLSSQGLPTIK